MRKETPKSRLRKEGKKVDAPSIDNFEELGCERLQRKGK